MDANLKEAIEAIQATAVASSDPKTIELKVDDGAGGKLTIPIALLRTDGGGVNTESTLQAFRQATEYAHELRLKNATGPDRREGTAQLQSLDSFITHANRFKAPESAVWANAAARQLVSVLDYHPAGATSPARWGKHRGTYACPLSEAWLAWGAGKPLELDQEKFSELLDSRDRELASGTLPNGGKAPDPAALITLASNLEVYSHATAKRERDPNTGRLKISFSEEKGVNGTVMPPPSFLVSIPVFQDGAPQPLEVRLRVTVEDGHAVFTVQLHAAGDVLREAFKALCDWVVAGTALPVFTGVPE